MASPSGGGASSLSQVGRALVRFVCFHRERTMSAVLRVVVSKAALAQRRFSSRVELWPPLRLPAYPSSAQSSQENQVRPGPSYLSGSRLGSKSLVSRATEHVNQSSTQAASSGGSSVAAAGDGSQPEPVQPPPSIVEIERQHLTAFALPSEVCNVILAARRPSTKTVYACRWNKFVAWCTNKSVDPLSATRSEVLPFILSLAQQGSALGTLKGYLSAMSAFLRLSDQPSLFKSPIVSRFLKGLTHLFPPTPFIMPQWDLKLVLTYLMCTPFEPMHNCPLRLLTFKTVFLVAITSARRVSELQALSSKPPYLSVHPDKVLLHTRAFFLPKVVTPFHVGQSITLPTFYAPPHPSHEEERLHRLDPKRALAFYLNRTKDFRVDDQLFVGYVGVKKGKAVVGSWLCMYYFKVRNSMHRVQGFSLEVR
ncbi:hypothetical protein NDU88_006631 [Pleurodeles waltl]|uniref:Core-binding (CB) domain-containing protein n=1 Tax=Pleurodeles waltl TaxID=8319 RepID=A0AAV7MEK2_PLEWA|nr:hypothetical protein NDU88_006631 [Pleurodeles waltl]